MENVEIMKKSVVESPKDDVLDGVIIDVQKGTWREVVNPDKINNFDNPDEDILFIKYQVKYKEIVLNGEDTFKYYENPLENSKLGKFLGKYGDLKPGTKVRIIYDGKGYGKIKVD